MKYLLSIFVLTLSLNGLGQTHFIGAETGLTRTNINGKNFWNNIDDRTRMSYGISYERHLNNNFQIVTGLTYFQKGFSSEIIYTDEMGNPTGETGGSISNNYDYLSLPLKTGYRLGNKLSGFANIGIAPSILLHAEVTEPAIEGVTEEKTTDITDKVSTLDLAGLAELGMSYELFKRFLISSTFSYQQGITSITNRNYFADSKMRHFGTALQFSIKYKLKN